MSTQTLNPIDAKELYGQYNWYRETFSPVVQRACDEFFLPGFKFEMIGISKNINALIGKEFYFVTKIKIDKNYDLFFRTSDTAISVILDRTLGKSNKVFNLNKITDLEAKIITAFNDYMFNVTSTLLSPPPANEIRRTNFDVINLTFLLKDEEAKRCGKFIVSVPANLVNPVAVQSTGDKFDYTSFQKSTIDVKIKVGSTRFSMHDLKNLDVEDTVIFDDSDSRRMTLIIDDYVREINLNPNLGLILPFDNNNGGNNMGAENLWDSIEVEMTAQFDAVKITLGELKAIEEGGVVDLTSIYGNKVTLLVEDKAIARGELVIVNDRYGVKVDEVIAEQSFAENQENAQFSDEFADDEFGPATPPPPQEGGEAPGQPTASGGEEEFDYSDFELDDEDI